MDCCITVAIIIVLLMVVATIIFGYCIMNMCVNLGIIRSEMSQLRKEKEVLLEEIRSAATMLDLLNSVKSDNTGL